MIKIGLLGNPNVGKSTIFNALTGKHQKTGNWPGKTVSKEEGMFTYKNKKYLIEDLPGTYSLTAKSKEEEVTRDYIYFSDYDIIIVVCDAVCLERNLNLLIQALEVTNKVILCINMMDEALKKQIFIDTSKLSELLNIEIVETSMKNKKGIINLKESIYNFKEKKLKKIEYEEILESSVEIIKKDFPNLKNKVYFDLLSYDRNLIEKLAEEYGYNNIINSVSKAEDYLYNYGIKKEEIPFLITSKITERAEFVANEVITFKNEDYDKTDRIIDKILTSKILSIPIMIIFLTIIFWITISGANKISDILYDFFYNFEKYILIFLNFLNINKTVIDFLINGVYRVLTWVISVMLPPVAIFFPLFSLLEDFGILPRIAFNLDGYLKKCSSCGKQALTMCMGIGCNAVAVTSARIIDSKRERLVAILTNSLTPCNGRFPAFIILISIFFTSKKIESALLLTLIILISIILTFLLSFILSKTLLKGIPSSFILELPPYRKPKILKVIITSLIDKAFFVLKRAVNASILAGIIIWFLAHISINDKSLLLIISDFFNPLGNLMGLDGVILTAFILGFPANEIVIPLMIMGYMSLSNLTNISDISLIREVFLNNDWTYKTALCFILFSLCHFPCFTTVLTIKKEEGLKYSIYSILIPLVMGTILCIILSFFLQFI